MSTRSRLRPTAFRSRYAHCFDASGVSPSSRAIRFGRMRLQLSLHVRELDHPVRGAELALTARGHERDPIHRNLADHVPARQSAFEAFPHQLAGTQPLCDLMKCPLAEMGGIREHVDATGGTDQRLRRYQAGQGSGSVSAPAHPARRPVRSCNTRSTSTWHPSRAADQSPRSSSCI